jgi:hypothetical protein
MGRALGNNLINMTAYKEVKEALDELGIDLNLMEDQEPDPALGNGGLGRLAACFLDSLASLGYAATYEKATLSALPADTSIVNTYVGKVDDVAKVIGYEVNVIFSFDTGHGNADINGKLFITITLEDNLIVTSSLSNGGSAASFSAKASEFAAKLVGLDSTVVATMTTSSHDGLDFVSGATVSSTEVLKLAISVANQYVNDKVVLNGGAA